jgi:hypothetical protein
MIWSVLPQRRRSWLRGHLRRALDTWGVPRESPRRHRTPVRASGASEGPTTAPGAARRRPDERRGAPTARAIVGPPDAETALVASAGVERAYIETLFALAGFLHFMQPFNARAGNEVRS